MEAKHADRKMREGDEDHVSPGELQLLHALNQELV